MATDTSDTQALRQILEVTRKLADILGNSCFVFFCLGEEVSCRKFLTDYKCHSMNDTATRSDGTTGRVKQWQNSVDDIVYSATIYNSQRTPG